MPDPQAHAPELTEGEAVSQFKRAVQEHGDAAAHFNLGSAYFVAHDLDHAFTEFQEALAQSPNLDHAHYYLGVIYKARGDSENARKEFQMVVNSNANMMLKSQATIQLKGMEKK